VTRKDYEVKLRERIRMQHKSDGTADAYWHWVNRFLDFNQANKIGKETKAEKAVEKFLTFLAVGKCKLTFSVSTCKLMKCKHQSKTLSRSARLLKLSASLRNGFIN
jgi:hypothetical protein